LSAFSTSSDGKLVRDHPGDVKKASTALYHIQVLEKPRKIYLTEDK
jgi:hypothetical protein